MGAPVERSSLGEPLPLDGPIMALILPKSMPKNGAARGRGFFRRRGSRIRGVLKGKRRAGSVPLFTSDSPLQKVLSLCSVCAVVLLKDFLRHAVERQRGNRAVEARRGHAPFTYGAAPAGKVVAINPDQTSLHASAFWLIFKGRGLPLTREGRSGKLGSWNGCPSPQAISHAVVADAK